MDTELSVLKRNLRKRRHLFVERQIEHLSLVCQLWKDESDPFCRQTRQYFNRLRSILHDLKHREDRGGEASQEEVRNLLIAEELYYTLPNLVKQLYSAYAVRQHRPLGDTCVPGLAAPPLSELHPNYAAAMRALDSINTSYSHKLSGFFPSFDFVAPLLVISGTPSWSLYGFPDTQSEFFSLTDPNVEERKKVIDYFLNLSWITVPLWAPVQIAHAAILAHANFHRVMQLCAFATMDMVASEKASDSSRYETAKFLEESLYGSGVMTLLRLWHGMAEGLSRLLEGFRLPSDGKSPDKDIGPLQESYRSTIMTRLQESAYACALEFFADIGGLMIAGPSFAFSLLADPAWVNTGVALTTTPLSTVTHPPMLSRVKLMVDILSHYGFKRISAQCDRMVSQYTDHLAFRGGERKVIRNYSRLLEENMEYLLQTADFVSSVVPHCPCGRIKRGELTEDEWIAEKEEIMTNALNGSFHKITQPAEEIVNTIWHKEVFRPELSAVSALTAWQIALSGCRTSD